MPCYVKSKKKKGFIITEYRIDGKKFITGKKIMKPKKMSFRDLIQ